MPRRHLLILAALFLTGCAIYLAWSLTITEPGYPLDDSWIHQVFARNLATGHGFSFNPDIPMSGATAPLWTLLMGLLWPLMGPIGSGILAGIILEFLAIIAIYKLTLLITNQNKLALIIAIITALTSKLIWGALSGMEIGLYSALALWGLYFYFKSESLSDKWSYLAYILFALAFLSRPECALFVAAAAIRDFFEWFKLPRKSLIPWLARLAIVAVITIPYFAFNYSVAGSIFPQTYTAKVQGRGLISALGHGEFKRALKAVTIIPYTYIQLFAGKIFQINPFIALAALAGLTKLWSYRGKLRSRCRMLSLLLLLVLPMMGAFAPLYTPVYHNLRIVAHLVPPIILLGVVGLFWKGEFKKFKRLFISVGSFLILAGALFLVFDDFFVRHLGPYFLQSLSRMTSASEYDTLTWFARDLGKQTLFLGGIIISALIISLTSVQNWLSIRTPQRLVLGLIILYSTATLFANAVDYAYNVKNINEIDKGIGLYLKKHGPAGSTVAVNDIGAIAYYSDMKVLDLKGLVSPEITPEMIQDDSLAFEYMQKKDRVDYLAIFPEWFKYIPTRTDIFKRELRLIAYNNTILADDTAIVYKAVWPDSIQ